MKRFVILALTLTLSSWLVACSNQARPSSEEKIASTLENMELRAGNKVERIRDYRVNSWQYIDHYNLIIKAGLKDNYLVSLHTPCLGLSGAFSIGFTSTAGTFDKFEDIIVKSSRSNNERCSISDIVKLEPIPKDSLE